MTEWRRGGIPAIGSGRRWGARLVACLLLWQAVPASAQIVLPGSADPLRLQERQRPQPSPRPSGPTIQLEEAPSPPLPPGAEELRFTLSSIAVDGVTVYRPSDLEPLWRDRIGREVSLTELYELATALTRKYRNDGYVLSRVVVPTQRVEGGAVRLEAIEGYIGRVTITGEVSRESLLRGYADKITALRPLQVRDLERYLLLMDDLAGATVGSVLAPLPGEPGAAELTIEMTHKALDVFGTMDNRGTRYIGPFQASAGARLNSILGFYELTQIQLLGTPANFDELRAYELRHAVPLDSEGTLVTLGLDQAEAHPGFTLKPLRLTSTAVITTVALSHPLIRLRAENLTLQTIFTATDLHTTLFDDAQTLLSDRIRSLQWGGIYDFVDRWNGINVFDMLLSQGFDILNARTSGSPNLSRANGRSDFTKLTGDAQRVQSLGGNWSILAAATGQYGFTSLLASEQFSIGGVNFVRAYDPAELTGDSGIAGKLELQYSEKTTGIGLANYQLYAYYDAGRVWNHQALASEIKAGSATAAGVGVRFGVIDELTGSLEVAKPLTRSVATEGDKDPRVFFSLVARF